MAPDHRRHQPFPYGVASGDPTSSAVTLWTYSSEQRGPIDWWVDDALTGDRWQGSVAPTDGFARVRVDGLPAGRELSYGFAAGDRASSEGRTTTLSVAPASVRLAVVCCSRWPDGRFDLYRRVAELKPDLVLHLGDYIYQDGAGGPRGDHEPDRPCTSEEEYRRRYAQYRSDPDLQSLHETAPWIVIWDDHEFTDDAWRFGARSEKSADRWRRRRRAAADAFRAWMPQQPMGNGPTSLDRSVSFGSLADLIVVDCRMAGRERPEGGAAGPAPEPDDERRLLTDGQWDWLDAQVAAATGPWLVLASSVQFLPLRLLPVPSRRWPGLRWLINPDQWDGYPSERRRLLDLLRRHDRLGTLVLSGDLHARFHSRYEHAGVAVHEVTTPSVTAPTFAELVRGAIGPVHPRLLAWWIRLVNRHIDHVDLTSHGATLLTISESSIAVRPIAADGARDEVVLMTGPALLA